MSSDLGIYFASFPGEGFRLTNVVSNIENIDFYEKGTRGRKHELNTFFGNSKVYATQKKVKLAAFKLYQQFTKDGSHIENGIVYIGEYENF